MDVGGSTDDLLQVTPADGIVPTGLTFRIEVDGEESEVSIFQRGLQERFPELTMEPDDPRYLPYVLAGQSRFLRVRTHPSRPAGSRLPQGTAAPVPLDGGGSLQVADYRDAIDRLVDDPRIDLVLAAVEPTADRADVLAIHQQLVAHAVAMADAGAPRIAFGSITPGEQDGPSDADQVREHAAVVRNRRFVLVAPASAAGPLAGVVARMNPQDSPTFCDEGVKVGGHEASLVDVALATPSFDALVMSPCRVAGGNMESTI